MEWIADPAAGAWLRTHLDPALNASMHAVVPRGFPAYARVFHPPAVRSLPDRAVPSPEEWERLSPEERDRLLDLFIDEPTTWRDAAHAFGTVLHPLAQWQSLVRTPPGDDWNLRLAPDGREFTGPDEGQLEPSRLSWIAEHLAAHTSTPDAGVAAIWGGWGGLLGHFGETSSRRFFAIGDDAPHHQEMLMRSIHDPFNNGFRKPSWQEGILSREISEGPKLELPAREHVLFSASARDFTDPSWVLRAPWRDLPAEEHGFAPSAYSPSILWPDDRAWVLVSEVDFDSTVVAGSAELVAALCADDRLEALPIPEGADLTWDADGVNAS
ncbi:hypothetical protein [Streptomyces sp. AC495_CC817]|uniref:hypothetical protein n=1 Tax=Streptomyces sp. AC495_CC817 TaxID=2823900 RepID=UPI001C2796B9|nr:hypothetical protein [Streptomyces sp. AC495_CC817]